jgi:hypothetical protein
MLRVSFGACPVWGVCRGCEWGCGQHSTVYSGSEGTSCDWAVRGLMHGCTAAPGAVRAGIGRVDFMWAVNWS